MAASWRLRGTDKSWYEVCTREKNAYGWLAPPSRKEPDWERAVIKFLGPSTQQTRQPGRRQFYMYVSTCTPLFVHCAADLCESIHDDNRVLDACEVSNDSHFTKC